MWRHRLRPLQPRSLELMLHCDVAQPLDNSLSADPIRHLGQQHDGEVTAQDRHLGVLDVASEPEQGAGNCGDDPGPVTTDGCHG